MVGDQGVLSWECRSRMSVCGIFTPGVIRFSNIQRDEEIASVMSTMVVSSVGTATTDDRNVLSHINSGLGRMNLE